LNTDHLEDFNQSSVAAMAINRVRTETLSAPAHSTVSGRAVRLSGIQPAQGRLAWQASTGYGQRSLVETTAGRYKTLIEPRLRARGFAAQQTEAAIGVAVPQLPRVPLPSPYRNGFEGVGSRLKNLVLH
jgi:hypothetical protein